MTSHSLQTTASFGPQADDRVLLLEEVDFKWLMAGQGWWIDTGRLHNDPHYAADLLELASTTQSLALRECAASLKHQSGCHCN